MNRSVILIRKSGRQFTGFSFRLYLSRPAGDAACALTWPGGQLYLGLVSPMKISPAP